MKTLLLTIVMSFGLSSYAYNPSTKSCSHKHQKNHKHLKIEKFQRHNIGKMLDKSALSESSKKELKLELKNFKQNHKEEKALIKLKRAELDYQASQQNSNLESLKPKVDEIRNLCKELRFKEIKQTRYLLVKYPKLKLKKIDKQKHKKKHNAKKGKRNEIAKELQPIQKEIRKEMKNLRALITDKSSSDTAIKDQIAKISKLKEQIEIKRLEKKLKNN